MGADDTQLSDAFHAFEADQEFRWTDGEAALPASLFEDVNGACELELHIACTAHTG